MLERGLGGLQETDFSLVLDLLLHILLILRDQILNFILECFRVLNFLFDFVGNLHPRCSVILELVNKEDLIDVDEHLRIITVILLLNLLNQSLELVVVE